MFRSEVEEGLKRFGISTCEDDIDLLFDITDNDNDGLITQTGLFVCLLLLRFTQTGNRQ